MEESLQDERVEQQQKIWVDDPMALVKHIDVIPSEGMSTAERYNTFSRLLVLLTIGTAFSRGASSATVTVVGLLWLWTLGKAQMTREANQNEFNQRSLIAARESKIMMRQTIHKGLEDGIFSLTKDNSAPFTSEVSTASKLMTNAREARNRVPIGMKIEEKIFSTRPPANYRLTEYSWLFARNPGPGKYDTGKHL